MMTTQYPQASASGSTSSDRREEQLLDALLMAVPLEIMQLRQLDDEDRRARARALGLPDIKARKRDDDGNITPEYRAEQERLSALPWGGWPLGGADEMLYSGPGTAKSFAAWVTALALLAFAPGGVRFGPLGFCAAHPGTRFGSEPHCPKCLKDAED